MKPVENDRDMSGDHYECKVCGDRLFLDYGGNAVIKRDGVYVTYDVILAERDALARKLYHAEREIEKLKMEADIMRRQLGIPDVDISEESLETIGVEIRDSDA